MSSAYWQNQESRKQQLQVLSFVGLKSVITNVACGVVVCMQSLEVQRDKERKVSVLHLVLRLNDRMLHAHIMHALCM